MDLSGAVSVLDQHSGASAAILTLALAVITLYYAWQTRATVKEMRAMREAQLRPQLFVTFEVDGETSQPVFVLANDGQTAGRNVRVICDPPITNPSNPGFSLESQVPLADGLPILPAHREFRVLLGPMWDYPVETSGPYQVALAYEDGWGRSYQDTFTLDFRPLRGILQLRREDPIEELKKLTNAVEKLSAPRGSRFVRGAYLGRNDRQSLIQRFRRALRLPGG